MPKGVRVFEQASVTDWKRTVVAQVLAKGDRPAAPMDGPLDVRMVFFFKKPQSESKRVRWPAKKPDADNLAKGVADGLNGVLWADDKQIVRLYVEKLYDENPGVDIEVREMAE